MEAINWDAIAALSEAFGAIAVVASLIFVGLQVRQSTDAAKIEAVHNISTEWRSVYQGPANNRQVAEILIRGGLDYKNLDAIDLAQYSAIMHTIFDAAASTYYQYDKGALDSETFDGICRQLRQRLGLPGVRDYWMSRKEIYSEQFQAYVDKEIVPYASNELYRQYKGDSDESTGVES